MIAYPSVTYDYFESLRQTNQWLGATSKAFWRSPAFGLAPSPLPRFLAGMGEVVERAYDRVQCKPDWNIDTIVIDEKEYVVNVETLLDKPFCNLVHFNVKGGGKRRKPDARRVLLVAPMSGHHATLIRKTVRSLLPDCDVFVTDWKNARDVPVSEGKFDIEDYTLYLVEFMKLLGSDLNVIAICQPAPLALAATAILAEEQSDAQPRSLTLIGGPIDPSISKTDVTTFGDTYSIDQLKAAVVHTVGSSFKGFGRQVYPGSVQLSAFMAMKWQMHFRSHVNQAIAVAKGTAADHDYHNIFYDEYLSVMDMTAEFYLSTVERIFQNHEIGKNEFTVAGHRVDFGKITRTAVKTVEGGKDDITAPGQCRAALTLLTGLDESKKAHHLEPDAGHYGIFSGTSWRVNIRPMVLNFIDSNSDKNPSEVDSGPEMQYPKPLEPAREKPAAVAVAAPAAPTAVKKASVAKKPVAKAKPKPKATAVARKPKPSVKAGTASSTAAPKEVKATAPAKSPAASKKPLPKKKASVDPKAVTKP